MTGNDVASLVPVDTENSLVRPAATSEEITKVFNQYQELCDTLLNDEDHQQIGRKKFRKKSAWRKLAAAFGVTLSIVDRTIVRNDEGQVAFAEFVARATAPNGRFSDGWASCDLREKCCPFGCSRDHSHCQAATGGTCSGAIHWSHPNHDIPATAETRAKNRAASDLFGMGEVSAEEVVGDGSAEEGESQLARKCPACGSGVWDNRPRIAAGTMNERAPRWKCKNKKCTGNDGEPWVSWDDDPFAEPQTSAEVPPWLTTLLKEVDEPTLIDIAADMGAQVNVDIKVLSHLFGAPADFQKELARRVGAIKSEAGSEPHESAGSVPLVGKSETASEQTTLGGEAGDPPVLPSEETLALVDQIDQAITGGIVKFEDVQRKASDLALRNETPIPEGGIDKDTIAQLGSVVLKALVTDLKLEERMGAKT